jgi:hypothetical protein
MNGKDSKWVQHFSGKGQKWEVAGEVESSTRWTAYEHGVAYHLPKSEYPLCDPPDVWEDVTDQVSPSMSWLELQHGRLITTEPFMREGYRLRKVKVAWFDGVPLGEGKAGWALIVERKKS